MAPQGPLGKVTETAPPLLPIPSFHSLFKLTLKPTDASSARLLYTSISAMLRVKERVIMP